MIDLEIRLGEADLVAHLQLPAESGEPLRQACGIKGFVHLAGKDQAHNIFFPAPQRIGSGLKENWQSLCEGAEDVFVFLVTSLPFLIPLAFAGILTLVVVKLANRKKKPAQQEKDRN